MHAEQGALELSGNEMTMVTSPCPFCTLAPERIVARTEYFCIVEDTFPVTEGHRLIVPGRHVESLFDLSEQEQESIWSVVAQVRADALRMRAVSGVNIGINDGAVAGQTVSHAHIHVIPRRAGDVADPRGGVRWVIAERARYW